MINFSPPEIATYYASRLPDLPQTKTRSWRGPCPVHNGDGDNFSVDTQTGMAHCHSQCGRGWDILSLEMELGGLTFAESKRAVFDLIGRDFDDHEANVVAVYDYVDANGSLRYQVVREHPKNFKQRRKTASGYAWNLKGVEPLPFNLPPAYPGGLTPNDQSNLAGFDNSELQQLSGGGTGNPDGSEMNPLFVQVAQGTSASGGGIGSILSDLSGGAGGAGSLIGSLLHLLPGFASGGDVDGPSIVGEEGPELFVPHTAGTIVPNSKMSGGGSGGNTIYVDARGSDNSAETELRVRRGIRQAHQQGAMDGARASRELRTRVPRSKVFAS